MEQSQVTSGYKTFFFIFINIYLFPSQPSAPPPPLSCCSHRRMSMAPSAADKGNAQLLQDSLPRGGVCLWHHPDLSKWSNWIYALQYKSCVCHSAFLVSLSNSPRFWGDESWGFSDISSAFAFSPFVTRKQISRNQ